MTTGCPIIALVDDDEAVRKALRRLFESAGFSVRAFGSAKDFLEDLKETTPDCLVLDLVMEGKVA